MARTLRKEKLPVRREVAAKVFDVVEFGAVPDGKTDCTVAIANAIAACERAGGGKVRLRGRIVTGPIHLRSNVELSIEGEVLFLTTPRNYLPAVPIWRDGIECQSYSPFIHVFNCANVAITGNGILRARGESWWQWAKHEARSLRRLVEAPRAEDRVFDTPATGFRPPLIAVSRSRDVRVEGLTLLGAGAGDSIQIDRCERVTLRSLILKVEDGIDNAGIAIDSTRNVSVEKLEVQSSGPAIILQAHESGVTQDVSVRDFKVKSRECALLIKGDRGGAIRGVTIADGSCNGSGVGFCFSASRGRGGIVEDIDIHDIDLGELSDDCIRLSAASESGSRRGRGPDFRKIVLRNIACRQAKVAVHLEGLPDQLLENIELHKVIIVSQQGLFCSLANGVKLNDVKIKPSIGPALAIRDSRRVTIDGMHQEQLHGIFLEVRGRQTREIVLRHGKRQKHRPSVVVGIDVPKDAIVHA
jgi:polygalacturonase